MSKRNQLIFRIIFISFTVICMAVIFYFSHQTGEESTAASENVTSGITNIIRPPDYENMTPQEQARYEYNLNILIRSNAHKLVYFTLAALVFCILLTVPEINFTLKICITYFFCLFYAATDELHQYFIPGRSGSVNDVLKDMHGVLIALISVLVIYSVYKGIIFYKRKKLSLL